MIYKIFFRIFAWVKNNLKILEIINDKIVDKTTLILKNSL